MLPELQSEIARLRTLLDALPFLVASVDAEQRLVYLNHTCESVDWFGRPLEHLVGKTVREVVGETDYEAIRPHIERALAGETVEYDVETTNPDALVRHRQVRYTPCRDPLTGRVVGYYSVTQDVTAQKEAEERVHWLAYHDSLTRLPNRALFHDRMEQSLAYATRAKQSLALLYIDLDGFKPINDAFGHDCGDQLLLQVAERLQESVRTEDTVCRLGGDEFVILLPFLSTRDEPVLVARRIHTALEAVFSLFPSPNSILHTPRLSACIGVSVFPDHGSDTETLLRHADQAMYQAKAEGPGSYCVYHRSGKL